MSSKLVFWSLCSFSLKSAYFTNNWSSAPLVGRPLLPQLPKLPRVPKSRGSKAPLRVSLPVELCGPSKWVYFDHSGLR